MNFLRQPLDASDVTPGAGASVHGIDHARRPRVRKIFAHQVAADTLIDEKRRTWEEGVLRLLHQSKPPQRPGHRQAIPQPCRSFIIGYAKDVANGLHGHAMRPSMELRRKGEQQQVLVERSKTKTQ